MREFILSSKLLMKNLGQLKYIQSQRIHFIAHDKMLYAGIKEAQGVGWIKAGEIEGRFDDFSVDGAQFMSMCKHLDKTRFTFKDGALGAEAIGGNFTMSNFPTERALDFVRNIVKIVPKKDSDLNRLLRRMKPALALACSVNSGVEIIQVFLTGRSLTIVGLAKTNSLGYVGTLDVEDKIIKIVKKAGLTNFTLPVEAIKTYLENEEANVLLSKNRVEVFSDNFYTIFLNKAGGLTDLSAIVGLLNTPPLASIKLDLLDFYNSIARIPGVKILSFQTAKDYLKIKGSGFAQIGLKYNAKILQGHDNEIAFNFQQLRAIVAQAKDYKGRLEWGNFLRLKCTTEAWEHNFLLAKVYDEDA